MDTIIVIVCVCVSIISGFGALSLWQDRTSQKGGVSPSVDVFGVSMMGVMLTFCTWFAAFNASLTDNPELNEGFVCKRVYYMLGDAGYNWAPDRASFSVNDTLGACTAPTRAAWEAAHRDGLLNGMVAMDRLDEVLEAQGVGIYERSDVTLAGYDLWKEASKYKK